MDYIVIALAMMLGGVVQGSCGFGAALISMSIMSLIIDYKIALPIMYLASVALNSCIIVQAYRHISWKIIVFPLVSSLLGRLLGLFIFSSLNSASLKLVLGCVICLIALFQLTCKKRFMIEPKPITGAIVGAMSGLFGGIASVGGPPLVVYYLNMNLSKEEYMVNMQTLLLCGTLFSISLLAVSGSYTRDIVPFGLTAIAGILIGAQIGLKLFDRINRAIMARIVNGVLVIMGLSFIIKYFVS